MLFTNMKTMQLPALWLYKDCFSGTYYSIVTDLAKVKFHRGWPLTRHKFDFAMKFVLTCKHCGFLYSAVHCWREHRSSCANSLPLANVQSPNFAADGLLGMVTLAIVYTSTMQCREIALASTCAGYRQRSQSRTPERPP